MNQTLIKITAKRIIERLDDDISDRSGLKQAWHAIDPEVMEYELKPTWVKIISEEISLVLTIEGLS